MTASVGSWISGSGTFSTRTSRLPCQVTALIASRSLRQLARRWSGQARVPGRPALNLEPIGGRSEDHPSKTIEYSY
ncbi:lysine--tRNA ligase [Streptomyces azureus]|uniref:Lysine--tRNA ligase n=1 Tax=Streptomyces azureus TaxID=146537 RepID=A0A0K8PGQ4_STRAJ|nr:lysine--tRNA ligase [Streptomyces azureus]